MHLVLASSDTLEAMSFLARSIGHEDIAGSHKLATGVRCGGCAHLLFTIAFSIISKKLPFSCFEYRVSHAMAKTVGVLIAVSLVVYGGGVAHFPSIAGLVAIATYTPLEETSATVRQSVICL